MRREGRFRLFGGEIVECVDFGAVFFSLYVRYEDGREAMREPSFAEPLDGLAVLIKQLAICAGEG